MKEVKAIIQSHMLTKVMEALHAIPHFPGVTASGCRGQGRGLGAGGHFVATEETIYFGEMTKLEIVCADATADEIVAVIRKAAKTGNPADGMIVVSDLCRVVRIRTGEEQEAAV